MKFRSFILTVFLCLASTACKQEKKPNTEAKTNNGSFSLILKNDSDANDRDLITRVKNGETRRVKSILDSGRANIYAADSNSETALMAAAETKNRELVDFILNKTEDGNKNVLDRGDKTGKTAMIYAAENGSADIIKDLRKKGADPNVYDQDKYFPLFIATKNNQLDAVNAILENISGTIPANPDLQTSSGETALIEASVVKNNEILKILKDYGANPNSNNASGMSPLALAAAKSDKVLFDHLLSLGADINYLIGGEKTVLIYAIESGNNDMAHYILDKGADPNIHAKVLPTPLQVLVSKDKADPGLVDYMITKGAKLTGLDIQGGNVISWAIHKGNAPAIKKLIEKGAKVTDLESADNSGVLMASNVGDPAIAALMVENGSDVSKPDADGYSPLALAAKNNFEDLFIELIKRGADVNSVSRNKYATPLEIVFANNNSDLLKVMFDNNLKVSPDAILLRAVNEKKDDLVAVALAYGARANIMNSSGQPAIWLAAARDDNKAVEDLIDNGADINVADTVKGISLLSLTILRGNLEIAKYLIEKGANPNLADKSGYTALTYAAVTGQDELVKTLIEHKAVTNVTDVSGNSISTLVDLSKTKQEKKDIIKKLLAEKQTPASSN